MTTRTGVSTALDVAPTGPNMEFLHCLAMSLPQLVVTNSTRQCSPYHRITSCQIVCDRCEYFFVPSLCFLRAVEAEASDWTTALIDPIDYCVGDGGFAFLRSPRQSEDAQCILSSPVDPVLDLGQNALSSTWETTLGCIPPGTVHIYHVLEVQIVDWSTG